jgi:hypothetical protein
MTSILSRPFYDGACEYENEKILKELREIEDIIKK